MYTNPTAFETGGEYVAVTRNLYMDNTQFGNYQGIFNAYLYNSSKGILTLQNPSSREFSAGTQPYLTCLLYTSVPTPCHFFHTLKFHTLKISH